MYVGKGDKDAAIKTLEEALAYAQENAAQGSARRTPSPSLQKRIDRRETGGGGGCG